MPNQESLKYLEQILVVVRGSPFALVALICIVAAFVLYILSVKTNGMSLINLLSYLCFIAFTVIMAILTLNTFSVAKVIYYAGQTPHTFNVGKFTRLPDDMWEDTSLYTSAGEAVHFMFKYKLHEDRGSTLILDAVGREGQLKIDMEQRQIFWLHENSQPEFLYHIIAVM